MNNAGTKYVRIMKRTAGAWIREVRWKQNPLTF